MVFLVTQAFLTFEFYFLQKQGLIMLIRLASNSWAEAVLCHYAPLPQQKCFQDFSLLLPKDTDPLE